MSRCGRVSYRGSDVGALVRRHLPASAVIEAPCRDGVPVSSRREGHAEVGPLWAVAASETHASGNAVSVDRRAVQTLWSRHGQSRWWKNSYILLTMTGVENASSASFGQSLEAAGIDCQMATAGHRSLGVPL